MMLPPAGTQWCSGAPDGWGTFGDGEAPLNRAVAGTKTARPISSTRVKAPKKVSLLFMIFLHGPDGAMHCSLGRTLLASTSNRQVTEWRRGQLSSFPHTSQSRL